MRPITKEDRKRIAVLSDTIDILSSEYEKYRILGERNLLRWKTTSTSQLTSSILICSPEDTLSAAMRYTKLFGTTFVILNMANSHVPGGGYRNGRAAQEENIYRRTNAFRLDIGSKYSKEDTLRISGQTEQGYPLRTLFCFRGGEDKGYPILNDRDVFDVVEMRSAAVNRNNSHMNDDEVRYEMTKRIDLQFRTLRDQGYRNVILGAFGCGTFGNDPVMISNIYRMMLERYQQDLDVVVFAILGDNYKIFSETLRYLNVTWATLA